MNENTKTLNTYNQHFRQYIDKTPAIVTADVKKWIDKTLSLVPAGSTVLEIGSAFGRDAKYMTEKGYKVTPTDAAIEFTKLMNKKGLNANLLNIITDKIPGSYDLIFANAVFVHFTIQQTKDSFIKIHGALNEGGIFSFRLKRGNGDKWTTEKLDGPRYFQYWGEEDVTKLLNETGFNLIEVTLGSSKPKDFKWLQFIAKKQ